MHYISTRGQAPALDFSAAALRGLAADGGLYVPESWPVFSEAEIAAWRGKPYREIAFHVLSALTGDALKANTLRILIDRALASFDHSDIAPLRQLDDRLWVMELFHGPTLAFKDIALQFLGQVFDHLLAQSGQRATVIGATSGDTGSAAMAGCLGCRNLDIFILYPHGGPSEIQRRQMTTHDALNLHAIAVEGSFDDCQRIVKAMFNDPALRASLNPLAVNSINWARIAAQAVYYFYAALQVGGPGIAPSFVIPTGNFGNIFSGFAAMQMGLPIVKLAAATNRNDAVHRFMQDGVIAPATVRPSYSPSMDIQIPSNLERLLFELTDRDGAATEALLRGEELRIPPLMLGKARQYFASAAIDDETTLKTIAEIHAGTGYLLDPHSAVGVAAAKKLARNLPEPVIALATAHPAKFPDTVARAIGRPPDPPPRLAGLRDLPERVTILPADFVKISAFITAARA